jgi:hypothetical protein
MKDLWSKHHLAKVSAKAEVYGVSLEVAGKMLDKETRAEDLAVRAAASLAKSLRMAGVACEDAEIQALVGSIVDAAVAKATAQFLGMSGEKPVDEPTSKPN